MEDNNFKMNGTFSVNDTDNDFTISGMAIHEGRYRDIFEIEPKEIKNCTKALEGAKLMKDHNYSVDNIIGLVTKTRSITDPKTGTKATKYTASIDPDEVQLIKKLKKGYIDSVSIGFNFKPYCSTCGKEFSKCGHWFGDEHDTHVLVRDIEIPELSLVYAGEDRNATASADFSVQKFKENFKQIKSDFMTDKTVEELQQTLADKEQEISDVTNKFENEIDSLKEEFAAFKDEKLNAITRLTAERNQFEKELNEAKEELEQFHKAIEEEKEAQLQSKIDEMLELADKFDVADTIDKENRSEQYVDSMLAFFKEFDEKHPQIAQLKEEQTDKYANNEPEEQFHIKKFFRG